MYQESRPLLKAVRVAITNWPWAQAATWAGVVIVLALLFSSSDGRLGLVDVINPLGFGVMTFFAYGGFTILTEADKKATSEQKAARKWAQNHPMLFALPLALVAGAILFGLRLVALGSGAEGPWSTVGDSALDMGFRAVIIYMIVSGTGLVMQRSLLKT